MEAIMEKTTKEDQRIARTSVDRLRKASKKLSQRGDYTEITLQHSDQPLRLPNKAISLLSTIISNMAAGKSMAIILSDSSVGTQEAADYLDVSRPHVVRLLEKGEIPFSKAGTHRRIKVSDLVAYQKRMKATRRKQLNFLAQQAQELGLGYSNE
ncbi:MAG TPA: helix-turn-helix domain-containing protein [Puia sp.]|uniref:helix-turn-helix domain-containing protein n=1 Tax=Puia sp. TaxID=2045100 RepID=UPI002B5472C6|nr:helix-turn-helix domain-containing protein [Puia sp.]HVU96909.1 helix-turn-helix domain-containing protein [Puia sp.]